MKTAQNSLETELGGLQEQLSRCTLTCYDKLVQRMGPDPNKYSEPQLQEFQKKLGACVDSCASDHMKLLPQIRDRLMRHFR